MSPIWILNAVDHRKDLRIIEALDTLRLVLRDSLARRAQLVAE